MTSPRRASDPYLAALALIPRGETRTFSELAALAGRPGAARAAGRAVGEVPADSPLPWHRVVYADGALARDPARAAEQARRLREEGADPARRAPPPGPTVLDAPIPPPADLTPPSASIEKRIAAVDWAAKFEDLLGLGYCVAPGLLAPAECAALIAHWPDAARFERTIDMAPRGYGVGVYRYWKEPLPEPAETLRRELYDVLKVAADMHRDDETIYPETLAAFQERCRAAGQRRASSILLRYPTGGVNHPHRDLYGREWFPFQALVVLSRRGRDFRGGDFTLLEKDAPPDAGAAIPLGEGDLLVFCSNYRLRGRRKVELRHAMRPVTRGERFALGIVFHTAE